MGAVVLEGLREGEDMAPIVACSASAGALGAGTVGNPAVLGFNRWPKSNLGSSTLYTLKSWGCISHVFQ